MKFIIPNIEHEQKAIEYIQELYDYSSDVYGSGGLDNILKGVTYSDWLTKLNKDMDIANVADNRVPAFTYFYMHEEDEIIVGMINIRLALNDFLRREGGHIGYNIRPTERRKGYATSMLREALKFCRFIGMYDFIITCDKANVASANVIKKCGGVLEEEFYSDFFNETVQRYKIV